MDDREKLQKSGDLLRRFTADKDSLYKAMQGAVNIYLTAEDTDEEQIAKLAQELSVDFATGNNSYGVIISSLVRSLAVFLALGAVTSGVEYDDRLNIILKSGDLQ